MPTVEAWTEGVQISLSLSGVRKFSLETETATPLQGSSQTLARTGQERKTPDSRSLDAGR